MQRGRFEPYSVGLFEKSRMSRPSKNNQALHRLAQDCQQRTQVPSSAKNISVKITTRRKLAEPPKQRITRNPTDRMKDVLEEEDFLTTIVSSRYSSQICARTETNSMKWTAFPYTSPFLQNPSWIRTKRTLVIQSPSFQQRWIIAFVSDAFRYQLISASDVPCLDSCETELLFYNTP